MKTVSCVCDKCKKPIDGKMIDCIAGGGELCTISYQSIMGHNKFPSEGFHYHYSCVIQLADLIFNFNHS